MKRSTEVEAAEAEAAVEKTPHHLKQEDFKLLKSSLKRPKKLKSKNFCLFLSSFKKKGNVLVD